MLRGLQIASTPAAAGAARLTDPKPNRADLTIFFVQGLQGMRDSLFTLLGPPRPLDATIRASEAKPLVQVCP